MCACTGATAASPLLGSAAWRGLALGAAGLGASASVSVAPATAAAHTTLTADQALARLVGGNDAFLADKAPPPPPLNRERRLEIARNQTPFAVLLSC
jgi:carbonic anhydrase